jgi:hypothetical protein
MANVAQDLEQIPRTLDMSALNALADKIECSPDVTFVGARTPAINVPKRLSRRSSETPDRNLSDERAGGAEVYESLTIFLAAKSWPHSREDVERIWADLVPLDHPKWDHEVQWTGVRYDPQNPSVILLERIGTKKVDAIMSVELESTIRETSIPKPRSVRTDHAPLYRSIEMRLYCDRRAAQDALQ